MTNDWRRHFSLLTTRAQNFLTTGEIEPGRHSAAFAAAASLRDVGVEQKVAETAVLRGARICSPPLSEADARRCVANAYNRR